MQKAYEPLNNVGWFAHGACDNVMCYHSSNVTCPHAKMRIPVGSSRESQ